MIEINTMIESLGSAMVRRIVIGQRNTIRDVNLADACDEMFQSPDVLILGHGVHDTDAALDLLGRAVRSHASGVVLQPPTTQDATVVELAGALGLSLIELQPTASWTHLVWLTRSILDHATAATGSDLRHNGSDYSELFGFADAAAAIVAAPVTIEDAHSRVLAYSESQETADPARISTIVGRRVPEQVLRHFRSRGVFRRLHTSDEPIRVDADPDGVLPRLIIPIRAGKELLGSIWVVDPGPVPHEQLRELTRTASVIALHLLRLRAVSGAARRMNAERMRAALITPDDESSSWLPSGPWRVVALIRDSDEQDLRYQLELWELTLRRFGWAHPLVTEVDGIPMTVVVDGGSVHATGSWSWLKALAGDAHMRDVLVVAGGAATEATDLPRSRSEAVELVGLARAGRVTSPATVDDMWHEIIIARAVMSLKRAPVVETSPVAQLMEHDIRRGTEYISTLATYLGHLGEPKRASALLRIHPNTLRYRIKSIVDLTGIDLADSRLRLALQLHATSLVDENTGGAAD